MSARRDDEAPTDVVVVEVDTQCFSGTKARGELRNHPETPAQTRTNCPRVKQNLFGVFVSYSPLVEVLRAAGG